MKFKMKHWSPWEDTKHLSQIAGTHEVSNRPEIPDYPTVRASCARLIMSVQDSTNALESGDIVSSSRALVELLLNTLISAQECGIPLNIVWDTVLEEIVASSVHGKAVDKESLHAILTELFGG